MISLCKEIIQTSLLTEVVAPPTMTDQTELTIAGVTSLHNFPPRLRSERGLVTTNRRSGPAGDSWCLWKSSAFSLRVAGSMSGRRQREHQNRVNCPEKERREGSAARERQTTNNAALARFLKVWAGARSAGSAQ